MPDDTYARQDNAYTQLRTKCMMCGLHFIVCTWNPEAHATTTMYCPECGQHEGRFFIWAVEVEGQIYEAVPGADAYPGDDYHSLLT